MTRVDVRATHTADLGPGGLAALRALLAAAFAEDLVEGDEEHALGGLHVLATDGADLVGHAAVVMRRLLHEGRALRTGYVEAVAVRPDRQGQGVGAAVMAEVERVVRGGYRLGALSSTTDALGFYAARGWQRWGGSASVLTPAGLQPTPEDEGAIFVLPVDVELVPGGNLACDWRDGDVW